MKKITISVVAILLLYFNASSQITKHNWMIGGNGGFSTEKTGFISGGNISSTQLSISPKIGYFPIDCFAFGLFINYRRVAEKSYNIKTVYSNVGIGPFVRYYFLSAEKIANIVIEGNAAYNTQSNNSISTKSGLVSYALLTGPVIYFNSSVGLEFLFGYKGYKATNSDTKNNGFHFNIGIQVHLERDK